MKQQFYVAGCVSKSLIVFGMSWDNGRPFFWWCWSGGKIKITVLPVSAVSLQLQTTGPEGSVAFTPSTPELFLSSSNVKEKQTHQRFFWNVIKSGQQSAIRTDDTLCTQTIKNHWLWEALARHHGLPSQDWINTDDFSAFIQVWTWIRTIFPLFSVMFWSRFKQSCQWISPQPPIMLFIYRCCKLWCLPHWIYTSSLLCHGCHPAITSAHKVSLISPIFIRIKDRRGFSARVCSCMQTEAQEKEIGSSIAWWGDFFKIQLLGSFHFRKAADYSSAEMLLIRSVRRSSRGEIFFFFWRVSNVSMFPQWSWSIWKCSLTSTL